MTFSFELISEVIETSEEVLPDMPDTRESLSAEPTAFSESLMVQQSDAYHSRWLPHFSSSLGNLESSVSLWR